MKALLRRWQTETGNLEPLGLARIGIGLLLLGFGLREWGERVDYFGDHFHLPYVDGWPVASRALYSVLAAAQVGLALVVVLGRGARPALLASALIGLYVFLCDRVQYHNNRYALLLFAGLLSLAPCDRAFALFARGRRGPAVGELWAQRLAQLQMSIIYLGSSTSKLLDADWRGGRVLADRLLRYAPATLAAGVPRPVVYFLCRPDVASALARAAISTELFLSVGLWLPRTRAFALWLGLWFHLTIEVTSKVEHFSWLSLTVYLLFVTPDRRARQLRFDPGRPAARTLARCVGLLDWLARFDIIAEPGLPGGLACVDRDGTRHAGPRSAALLCRALPLLFPAWLPVWALSAVLPGLGSARR